jgi:hypothetical protein
MVTPAGRTRPRGTAAFGQAPAPARPVKGTDGPDRNGGAYRNGGAALMTPGQVAGLLEIDIGTVGLWSVLGVLPKGPPPDDVDHFRRADVVTFLPVQPGRRTAGEEAGRADRGPGPSEAPLVLGRNGGGQRHSRRLLRGYR